MAQQQGGKTGEWLLTSLCVLLLMAAVLFFAWLIWRALADNGHAPEPPLSPPPTRAAVLTVLPTATPPLVFTVPTMTPEPTFVADSLPMATSTPRPTGTRVPATATQTPNLTPAVQKG